MSATSNKGRKGIVLAGGAGTRLYPMTRLMSKQLLPVYDKPMVYYPLSILMLGGIRDIMIISTPQDLPLFEELLGDGERIGVRFSYVAQPEPKGIAQAFLLGADFLDGSPVCLILGDNLFYGDMSFFRKALARADGATVFGYPVQDPERYGVVEFGPDGRVISIEEKPEQPKSRYAVPGLYCYDEQVVQLTRGLTPSARGELEITDLNNAYLKRDELYVELLGRGIAWLDTGTPQSLLEAANFVATVESRQGLNIGCVEEVAHNMGFIDRDGLIRSAEGLGDNAYRQYLMNLADDTG